MLILSGCETVRVHEGSELPNSQIAILKHAVSEGFYGGGIRINNIDGKLFSNGQFAPRFQLLPGRHRIAVSVTHLASVSPAYIEFEAKAGHSYLLRTETVKRRVFCWILDNSTGMVVAGTPP